MGKPPRTASTASGGSESLFRHCTLSALPHEYSHRSGACRQRVISRDSKLRRRLIPSRLEMEGMNREKWTRTNTQRHSENIEIREQRERQSRHSLDIIDASSCSLIS